MNPDARAFLASQFGSDMTVLDIGCGNGATLLEHAGRFRSGVGIDNDPAHLALAEGATAESGVSNVEFLQLEIDQLPHRGWKDRFDLVFTERGPFGFESPSATCIIRKSGTCSALVRASTRRSDPWIR